MRNDDQDNEETDRGRDGTGQRNIEAVAAECQTCSSTSNFLSLYFLIASLVDCIRCMYVEAVITNFAVQ